MEAAPRTRWRVRSTALLLAAFAVLVCTRMPAIVVKGRFWAEEGLFFRNAWTKPPVEALLAPVGGYLNIAASGVTLAASALLPLAYAPYLTIAMALLVQLFPPLLLLTARDEWLQLWPARLGAVLLLLLLPASEEIWLHTLHCQFELTLCCGIILALDADKGWRAALRLCLLVLAPLCGPGAITLLPLFVARAALERSAARGAQALMLSAGAAVQLLAFFTPDPRRAYTLDPAILLTIIAVRHLAVPLFGLGWGQAIAVMLRAAARAGEPLLVWVIPPLMLLAAFGIATLRVGLRGPAIWLFVAAGLTGASAYFGAFGGGLTMIDARFGERYTVVPQALLALSTVALAATAGRRIAVLSWCLSVWLMVVGAAGYFSPWPLITDGPAWREEVAVWQADPSHPLLIWPAGCTVTLPPRTQ